MDQIKIGRFIAERRKLKNLTQAQLAEKLNITDRAVSKWERGKSLPDSSIMLELCEIFEITVNDLLCGEVVSVDENNKDLEKRLLEIIKEKESADKRLLVFEGVYCAVSIMTLIALIIVAMIAPLEEGMRTLIIIIGMLPLMIGFPFMNKVEQTTGYYECKHCEHRYVPTYKDFNFSMHMGTTRYMKCPKCNKKSWQKKVMSKYKD